MFVVIVAVVVVVADAFDVAVVLVVAVVVSVVVLVVPVVAAASVVIFVVVFVSPPFFSPSSSEVSFLRPSYQPPSLFPACSPFHFRRLDPSPQGSFRKALVCDSPLTLRAVGRTGRCLVSRHWSKKYARRKKSPGRFTANSFQSGETTYFTNQQNC